MGTHKHILDTCVEMSFCIDKFANKFRSVVGIERGRHAALSRRGQLLTIRPSVLDESVEAGKALFQCGRVSSSRTYNR